LCGYSNNYVGDDAYTWVVKGQGKKREIGDGFQMAEATIDEVSKYLILDLHNEFVFLFKA
jgi:hypothetical protein